MSEQEKLFLESLPLIEKVAAFVCRRHALSADEAEDLTATVKLRLIQDDYAILRAYEGRSALGTFLSIVVERFFYDYYYSVRGKWHTSREAGRLGVVAVDLERCLQRDGMVFEQACAVVESRYPNVARCELEAIAASLPQRERRRRVEFDAHVANIAAPDVAEFERRELTEQIGRVAREAIDQLPSDEQLMLYLRFEARMSVPQIARAMHIDQRSSYRRLDRILAALREKLRASGVSSGDVQTIIGHDAAVLDFNLYRATPVVGATDEKHA